MTACRWHMSMGNEMTKEGITKTNRWCQRPLGAPPQAWRDESLRWDWPPGAIVPSEEERAGRYRICRCPLQQIACTSTLQRTEISLADTSEKAGRWLQENLEHSSATVPREVEPSPTGSITASLAVLPTRLHSTRSCSQLSPRLSWCRRPLASAEAPEQWHCLRLWPRFSSDRRATQRASNSAMATSRISAVQAFSLPRRGISTLALFITIPAMATAHEHGVSHIAEGETTSKQPLVRPCKAFFPAVTRTPGLTSSSGLDIMGAHLPDDGVLRGHLPRRHGARSKSHRLRQGLLIPLLTLLSYRSPRIAGTFRLRSSAPASPSLPTSSAMPTAVASSFITTSMPNSPIR